MNRRTLIAAASAAFFSSACGGGGDKPQTVAFFGDSLSYGNVPGGRLPVTPAARLAELTGFEVCDYTAGAATLRQAFGEPVPFIEGTTLTADMLPHGVFPGSLASRPADIVLMRYGGADALLHSPLSQFADLYAQAVRTAQGAGCRVFLAGIYDHPGHPELNAYDDAAARVAAEAGAAWVDLRRLVLISYPQDLADDLHGTQQTSDRWIAAMAAALKGTA